MITVDFAIVPVGTQDTECKEYVKSAVQVIKDSGINYQLTGMGTQFEVDTIKQAYELIEKAQEEVFKAGTDRLYTIIKMDDRRDKENRTLNAKIDTVEKILE